jgi:hypothetical protein
MLAAHEENCEGMRSLVRATAFRYPLTETAKTMPASTIVVGSSSGFSSPPGWFADKSTLEEGLQSGIYQSLDTLLPIRVP